MFDTLREDIRCVFERDPAARNAFEIVTTYPGFHALCLHRVSHRMWGWGLTWPAKLLAAFSRWLTGIEIHPAVVIGRRFFMDHGMGIVIGETSEIGDDCTLYQSVTLGGTTWNKGKRHPTLESGVVVGAGAKVLGPITVGSGARIGSNAVVVKDVPAGATVIGIPGHVVRERTVSDEKRQRIASRMGFDAYGVSRDLPDPVADAIHLMLDHIHAMDKKMDAICDTIDRLGGHVEAVDLPDLDDAEIEPDAAEEPTEPEPTATAQESRSGNT
jgi:serine O-acetyltransferase